jgi:shikimate dehydrogenase
VRFALLGDPVAHSRSPAIHAAALRACGIAGIYTARRVDVAGLYAAVAEVRAGALSGANVTMPFKRTAAAAADRLTADAAAAGSVNTLACEAGEVVGDSTDVTGLRDVWLRRGLPDGGPVLVLGSGGAAAAALVALQGRDVRVAARRTAAAAGLTASLGIGSAYPWGEPLPGAAVVNATPLGMEGEALPGGVVAGAVALVDLAYGPEPTPAVREALAASIPVADGIDVLVAQAARSFTRWTRHPAPLEVMEAAARS